MYGIGILKGLGVTLRRFVETYTADLEWWGTKRTPETFAIRQGPQSKGLNTVEYPDEKTAVPERFRFIPFLVVNNFDEPYAPGHDWCTSCGICAKVCPPQCIWIVRGKDPNTGRPKPEPEAFYIDIDICMNCGYCSEYCPFDAIKMDHDYELASFDRTTNHIYDKKKLSKEVRYWQTIAPTTALEEAIMRGQWEHKDTLKVAKKAGIPMTEPVWENRGAAQHNPEIVKATQQAAAADAAPAPAAAPGAAAPAPQKISIDVESASVDQLANWSADESLPLEARAAAGVKLDGMIRDKEFKPTSTHRKAVSAVKKAAKAEDKTIEELASGFSLGEVTTTPAAPAAVSAAPASAQQPAAPAPAAGAVIDVEGAEPAQLAEWSADESLPLEARAAAAVKLDGMIREKTYKPSSTDRKALSAAKKAAKEADTSIEDAAQGFTPGGAVAAAPAQPAAAPAAPPPAAPAEAAPPAEGGGDLQTEIEAARELERKGKAKEIKLSSADRKRIAEAKKAAKEAGIDW
ncbi:MAG: 4Fe-4S dicluster domain-containing protein [Chloroflexi bacterium]|nr:4Fe-4S dicluster domain-containing protein [Chloroflexota bacterium]